MTWTKPWKNWTSKMLSKIPAYLPIQVIEHKENGYQAIRITGDPFAGIVYSYGKVSLDPDEENGQLKIHFEYEILDYNEKALTDTKPFEQYIGDILQELIHLGIQENSLTYTGGVDENRTEDSNESDSR